VREVERNLNKTWDVDEDGARTQVWRNLANLVEETGTTNMFGAEWRAVFAAVRK
jgi:hypothetical protein